MKTIELTDEEVKYLEERIRIYVKGWLRAHIAVPDVLWSIWEKLQLAIHS